MYNHRLIIPLSLFLSLFYTEFSGHLKEGVAWEEGEIRITCEIFTNIFPFFIVAHNTHTDFVLFTQDKRQKSSDVNQISEWHNCYRNDVTVES